MLCPAVFFSSIIPPHSIGIVSDGCLSLKLLEERGEFGEMSESTLLWDGIIIRLTRQNSFNSFINNTSLNLCIGAMDNSEYREQEMRITVDKGKTQRIGIIRGEIGDAPEFQHLD